MKKREVPYVLYLYIHSKIYDMTKGEVISLKEGTSFLSNWRIPKQLRILVIKELEILGLVEKKGKLVIKVNKPEYNKEKHGKYARQLGLWWFLSSNIYLNINIISVIYVEAKSSETKDPN